MAPTSQPKVRLICFETCTKIKTRTTTMGLQSHNRKEIAHMSILVTERHAETRTRITRILRDMANALNATIRTQNTSEGTLWYITGLDDGTEHIFSLFRTGELFEVINTPDGKTWCGPTTVEALVV